MTGCDRVRILSKVTPLTALSLTVSRSTHIEPSRLPWKIQFLGVPKEFPEFSMEYSLIVVGIAISIANHSGEDGVISVDLLTDNHAE